MRKKFFAIVLAASMLVGSVASAAPVNEKGAQAKAELAEASGFGVSEGERSPYFQETARGEKFNENWKFHLTNFKTAEEVTEGGIDASGTDYDDAMWEDVELPHDYQISNGEDSPELYANSEAWYRKTFYVSEKEKGKTAKIRFDGVYMNAAIYVNGQKVGENPYGYSTFTLDISSYLHYGNEKNTVAVKVVYQNPNSRWYSGGGIYRSVWLSFADPVHVDTNGTYISTDGKENVTMDTTVVNKSSENADITVRQTVVSDTGKSEKASEKNVTVEAGKTAEVSQEFAVQNAKIWDVDDPNLYQMKTEILKNGKVIDTYYTDFGFRKVEFTTDHGMYLNGKQIKLHGVCLHHDQGALGAEANYRAIERQLQIMKDMGVNAIRTTHNPADPSLLEICDRLGLLVVEEFTDMWKNQKNTYDYGAYFEEWAEHDLSGMVSRDRSHPSIIMWSIGNEISDTMNGSSTEDEGAVKLATKLMNCAYASDSRRNGVVTVGSNYMKWNGQLAADVYKFAGYNYGEDLYDEQHEAHPDWYIYGSETSSAVRSRGIYHLPVTEGILTHADEQCSSYDNSFVSWGRSAEDSWIQDRDREYVLGQFVWTGFDYIGEPTPYSTKNSYFGIVDTAGIPKDVYYFYQSVWTDVEDNPMVHILPGWDFTEGETIPVYVYTNAPKVELFLDGKSLGVQTIDHENGSVLHGQWDVVYKKGTSLTAKIYDEAGNEIKKDGKAVTDTISSYGDTAKLKLTPDRNTMSADGEDLIYVEISGEDADGNFTANARNRIEVSVSGAGTLAGLDNGDSTDYEFYQAHNRKLFSGKLMAIIRSDGTEGDITVTAKSAGVESESITLTAKAEKKNTDIKVDGIDGIRTITEDGGTLGIETVTGEADNERISYSVTDADGNPTDAAVVEQNGTLKAVKNGTVKVVAEAADGNGTKAEVTVDISGQSEKVLANAVQIEAPESITENYQKFRVTAGVEPENAGQNVKWTLSKGADLAKITEEGWIRAKGNGEITVRAEAMDGSGVYAEKTITLSGQVDGRIPVRKIEAVLQEGSSLELTKEQPSAVFDLQTYPAGAVFEDSDAYCAVSDSSMASAKVEDGKLTVTGKGDGAFTVTVGSKNGGSRLQAYQELKFTVTGMGKALKDPYAERIKGADYDVSSQVFSVEGDGALGGIYARSWAGYLSYDFGRNGSKSVKIYAGTGEYEPQVDIYEGNPDEGGRMICSVNLKPSGGWDAAAVQTLELPETLTGAKDIYFVLYGSIAFGGFQFVESDEIAPIRGTEYDSILGDSYENITYTDADGKEQQALKVGNNTSVVYKNVKFGEKGAEQVTFYGATEVENCTIQLRYKDDSGQTVIESLNFTKTGDNGTAFEKQSFKLSKAITGERDVELMYMPGNPMSIGWFRFEAATSDSGDADDAKKAAEEAKAEAEKAKAEAEKAKAEAEAAKEAAEKAKAEAEAAKEAEERAKAEAEAAKEAAARAEADAKATKAELEKAKEEAKTAAEEAKQAAEKAEKAKAEAEKAQKLAEEKAETAAFTSLKGSIKAAKSSRRKTMKVTWKAISDAEGYEILYAQNAKLKNAKTVTVKKNAVTLKNLKAGKKYYVRIRAYKTIAGSKVYTKYSNKKNARIKK